MTEATTGANKAETAKHTASSFGVPNYEVPKFDLPKIEMPEVFRERAEKGVAHAKDTYAKAKAAAGQATDVLKDTYATAAKGATDYNLKIIEFARAKGSLYFFLRVKNPRPCAHLAMFRRDRADLDHRAAEIAIKNFQAAIAGEWICRRAQNRFIKARRRRRAER